MLFEKDGVSIYDKSKASRDFISFGTIGTTVAKLIERQRNVVHQWEMDVLSFVATGLGCPRLK
jgi:hypothetical protein